MRNHVARYALDHNLSKKENQEFLFRKSVENMVYAYGFYSHSRQKIFNVAGLKSLQMNTTKLPALLGGKE